MADILPVLLKYQHGEEFTKFVFIEKEEGVYYADDLNVPVTGTSSKKEQVKCQNRN